MADEPILGPKELEKLDRRVEGLRNINNELTKELNNSGAGVDVSTARIEKLIEFLIGIGVVTPQQRLQEQEAWELHLRSALKPLVDQVRAARTAQGVPVRRNSGLIIPGRG